MQRPRKQEMQQVGWRQVVLGERREIAGGRSCKGLEAKVQILDFTRSELSSQWRVLSREAATI